LVSLMADIGNSTYYLKKRQLSTNGLSNLCSVYRLVFV